MSIFEYNKEEEEKKLRKAEFEYGYEGGYEAGQIKKTEEIAVELLKAGMTSEKIAEILKVSEAEVEKWTKIKK